MLEPEVRVAYEAIPRIPRGRVAGQCLHVLNRENGGAAVIHKDVDCLAFLEFLGAAKAVILSRFLASA